MLFSRTSNDENSFGTTLFEMGGIFPYIHIPNGIIPWKKTTFSITTRGLKYTSFQTGGDPLEWDKIQEPSSSNATYLFGINFRGNITFNTPISLVVTGKDGKNVTRKYPDMPYKFYKKLLAARSVALMFKDEKKIDEISWRERALLLWAKKFQYSKREVKREEYVDAICQERINELFRGDSQNKKKALDLYKKGKIPIPTFNHLDNVCRGEILDIIGKAKPENPEPESPEPENPTPNKKFRDKNKSKPNGNKGKKYGRVFKYDEHGNIVVSDREEL